MRNTARGETETIHDKDSHVNGKLKKRLKIDRITMLKGDEDSERVPSGVEHDLRATSLLDNNKMAVKTAREQLEAEKNARIEEEIRVCKMKTSGKIVTLNVGGSRYTTTLSTLTKYPDSMLGTMFSGRHALVQQEDGSYFIDRDGESFRYILMYLRDDRLARAIIPKLDTKLLLQLTYDAEYFQVQELETIARLNQTNANQQRSKLQQTTSSSGLEGVFRPLEAVKCKLDYKDQEIVLRNEAKRIQQELTTHCNLCCENVAFLNKVSFKMCDMSGSVFQNCYFKETVSFEGSILLDVIFENVGGLQAHFTPWQVAQAKFEPTLLNSLKTKRLIY